MSAPILGLAITMVMAPTGQASAHRPWPMHLCPLMMAALPPSMREHVALRTHAGAALAADAERRVNGGMLRARPFRIYFPASRRRPGPPVASSQVPEVERHRNRQNKHDNAVDQARFIH